MSAIAGASAGVKDMADGSLRITIEFEPKDAKQAFELFGARGTPVALAALREGFQAVSDVPKEPSAKVGPMCREAVDLCKMPEFQEWAAAESGWKKDEVNAKEHLLAMCGCESRKELDSDSNSAAFFVKNIRIPFMRYMKQRQTAKP